MAGPTLTHSCSESHSEQHPASKQLSAGIFNGLWRPLHTEVGQRDEGERGWVKERVGERDGEKGRKRR